MDRNQKNLCLSLQRMRGRAALTLHNDCGKTTLQKLFQEGAAKLRFLKSDSGIFEGVMINIAGGMTGGDHLEWDICLEQGAKAILTTQAAEKIYRSLHGESAKVNVSVSLASKARLCWLPQETILFNDSQLDRKLDVHMEDDAELLLGETIIFGRKQMGEILEQALMIDRWIIRRNHKIIHADSIHLGPDMKLERMNPFCLNGSGVMASFLLISRNSGALLAKARELIAHSGGASAWNGKLFVRLIEKDFYALRKKIIALVTLLNDNSGVPAMWLV